MFKLLSIILVLGGVAALVAAAWSGLQGYRLLQSSGQAQGEVVELVEVRAAGNAVAWSPGVSFAAPDGTAREFVSKAFANPPDYTVGQKVDIRYALGTSARAEIDDLKSLWGKTFGLALLGTVLCGVGGFTFWLEQAGPGALQAIDTGRVVGTVFVAAGPVVLVMAAVQAAATLTFVSSSHVAQAVVERLQIVYGQGGSFVIHPVLAFETAGRKVHFISEIGSYPAAYQAGEAVRIRFSPEFPERARIDSWWSAWSTPLIMGGVGIVFTLLGWLVLRVLATPS